MLNISIIIYNIITFLISSNITNVTLLNNIATNNILFSINNSIASYKSSFGYLSLTPLLYFFP